MSHTSKEHYLESCRQRYPSRNRAGKSTMIDEVSDTLGWDRKHTIKALGRKVSEETKTQLRAIRAIRADLDPMDLAADIEARLGRIFTVVAHIEEDRQDEMERAGIGTVGADSVTASVAIAPCAFTASAPTENLVKPTSKNQNQTKRRVS